MENQTEMEIDVLGLLLHLKSKIWIILIVTLTFALGGYFSTKLLSTPVYTANLQLYIYQDTNRGMDSNVLTTATMVRRDCAVIIKSESVTKEVVSKLGLGISAKDLGSAIRVDSDDNTRILKLTYSSVSPEQAALVLNTVGEVAGEQVKLLMGEDVAIKPVYEASVPQSPSNLNERRNTILATVIGLVLTVSVLIVVFLLDDSIRNEDDVENYLGLSTLAAIPMSDELFVSRGSRRITGKKKAIAKRNRR